MLHVKKLQKCTRGTEVPRMFSWCNYEADCSHFRLIIFKLDVFCLCWLGRDRAEFSFTLLSDVVTLAHWTFCFHVLVDLKERQKSPIVAADRPTLNECPPLNRHHVTGTFCPQTGLIRCRFSAMFLPQDGVIAPVEAGGTPSGLSPGAQLEKKSHGRFITVLRMLGKHPAWWGVKQPTLTWWQEVED